MTDPSDDSTAPAVCAFVRRTIADAVNRVRVARWIGEQAVTYGRTELAKAFAAGATPAPGAEPAAGGEPVPADLFVSDSFAREQAPSSRPVDDIALGDVAVEDNPVADALIADILDADIAADDLVEEIGVDEGLVDDGLVDDVAGALAETAHGGAGATGSNGSTGTEEVASGEAPFEGYDTLPAAHIVQRLGRLTPRELGAVRAYELGHRGRRTVVAKVDQLLDAG